jgi:hypothetical protein
MRGKVSEKAASYKLQATSYRLQATGYKLQAICFKYKACGLRLEACSLKLFHEGARTKILKAAKPRNIFSIETSNYNKQGAEHRNIYSGSAIIANENISVLRTLGSDVKFRGYKYHAALPLGCGWC